jgi:hypothetical protein
MEMRDTEKRAGLFVFVVFLGAITGSLIGDIVGESVKSLSFFKSVFTVGTSQPIHLNLKVIAVTFGLNFNINLMSIIGIILSIILVRKY